MRRFAILLVVLVLAVSTAAPVQAQTGNGCLPGQTLRYAAGFAALKEAVGAPMGDPVTCEYPDPKGTGDVQQRTTTGLAFWRESTNTPAFTNGAEHWALANGALVYWTGTSIDPPLASRAGQLYRGDPRGVALQLADLGPGWDLQRDVTEHLGEGIYEIFFTRGPNPVTVGSMLGCEVFVSATPAGAHEAFQIASGATEGWVVNPPPNLGDEGAIVQSQKNGARILVVRVKNVVLQLGGPSDLNVMLPPMQRLIDRVNTQLSEQASIPQPSPDPDAMGALNVPRQAA